MLMEKKEHLSVKQFFNDLKGNLKSQYKSSVWPVAGGFLLMAALGVLFFLGLSRLAMTMMMSFQMMMYGMASPLAILMTLLEVIILAVLLVALSFFVSFFATSSSYAYLDALRHPGMKVNASAIWTYFKHVRKNQLWRLVLYNALFLFLWQLPLSIVGRFTGRWRWLSIIILIVNDLIQIWKTIEYSQSAFLYRDRQTTFLGQSMRHALTASRRYMGGRKANYIEVMVTMVVIPLLVIDAIFGGIAFYGNYIGTYWIMWVGIVLGIIAVLAFLPVVLMVVAQFYDQTYVDSELDIDFSGTFKPVEKLNGAAFINDWQATSDVKTSSKDKEDTNK